MGRDARRDRGLQPLLDDVMWSIHKHLYLHKPLPNDLNVASIATPFKQELLYRRMTRARRGVLNLNVGYDPASDVITDGVQKAREGLAALLNAPPETIYLAPSATNITRLLAEELPPGGNAIVSDEDFETIKYQLGRHFEIIRASGPDLADAVARTITPETRLILASYVTHDSCERQEVERIIEIGDARGVPVVIDAAQAVGHIPVDIGALRPAGLIGSGHKWLRGRVSGFAYLDPARFAPTFSTISPYTIPTRTDAQRRDQLDYDGAVWGEQLAHLGHTLETWHTDFGWPRVFARISDLGAYARDVLARNPYVLRLRGNAPGMVSFCTSADPQAAHAGLQEHGVRVSLKPSGWLRVSVSPFVTHGEIDYLSASIRDVCARLPYGTTAPIAFKEIATQDVGFALQGRT